MMKKMMFFIGLVMTFAIFSGCTAEKETDVMVINEKITAEKAKEMMNQDPNIIILDVRSLEEFSAGHIKGALLIPDNEITDKAGEMLADKTATILVYCRSGRRSAIAAEALVKLGYTKIYDFGGIIDWKYDVVVE